MAEPSEMTRLMAPRRESNNFARPPSQRRRVLAMLFLGVLSACCLGGLLVEFRRELGRRRDKDILGRQRSSVLQDLERDTTFDAPCQSTVLLLRHCEDLGGHTRYRDGTKHCSWLGFERTQFLARHVFGSRYPPPDQLIVLQKGHNQRQYETLQPLIEAYGLNVTMLPYPGLEEVRALLFGQLASGDLCGKLTVVAWKHAWIPTLAELLGCAGCPGHWDDDDFDSMWQIYYMRDPPQKRQDNVVSSDQNYTNDYWVAYGSVVEQSFDPLAFRNENAR